MQNEGVKISGANGEFLLLTNFRCIHNEMLQKAKLFIIDGIKTIVAITTERIVVLDAESPKNEKGEYDINLSIKLDKPIKVDKGTEITYTDEGRICRVLNGSKLETHFRYIVVPAYV